MDVRNGTRSWRIIGGRRPIRGGPVTWGLDESNSLENHLAIPMQDIGSCKNSSETSSSIKAENFLTS